MNATRLEELGDRLRKLRMLWLSKPYYNSVTEAFEARGRVAAMMENA